MREIRKLVHELTNILQTVVGFIEIEEYGKAKKAIRKAIPLADKISQMAAVELEKKDE